MTAIAIVRAGESLEFEFELVGETASEWVCTIKVLQFPGGTAQIDRVIVPTGNVWEGHLTSSETAGLDPIPGLYRIIALITNATTEEERQIEKRFSLTEAWV